MESPSSTPKISASKPDLNIITPQKPHTTSLSEISAPISPTSPLPPIPTALYTFTLEEILIDQERIVELTKLITFDAQSFRDRHLQLSNADIKKIREKIKVKSPYSTSYPVTTRLPLKKPAQSQPSLENDIVNEKGKGKSTDTTCEQTTDLYDMIQLHPLLLSSKEGKWCHLIPSSPPENPWQIPALTSQDGQPKLQWQYFEDTVQLGNNDRMILPAIQDFDVSDAVYLAADEERDFGINDFDYDEDVPLPDLPSTVRLFRNTFHLAYGKIGVDEKRKYVTTRKRGMEDLLMDSNPRPTKYALLASKVYHKKITGSNENHFYHVESTEMKPAYENAVSKENWRRKSDKTGDDMDRLEKLLKERCQDAIALGKQIQQLRILNRILQQRERCANSLFHASPEPSLALDIYIKWQDFVSIFPLKKPFTSASAFHAASIEWVNKHKDTSGMPRSYWVLNYPNVPEDLDQSSRILWLSQKFATLDPKAQLTYYEFADYFDLNDEGILLSRVWYGHVDEDTKTGWKMIASELLVESRSSIIFYDGVDPQRPKLPLKPRSKITPFDPQRLSEEIAREDPKNLRVLSIVGKYMADVLKGGGSFTAKNAKLISEYFDSQGL